MGLLKGLAKVAIGAGLGIVAITALPVLGATALIGGAAAGTISAAGIAVGSTIGGAAGFVEGYKEK